MKIKDLRKLKSEEMEKKLSELNSELIKLKGQASTGTAPKSPGQIKQIKRTIAQILTVKNQKNVEEK